MSFLPKARALFTDGTFKMVPKTFRQLLIINGQVDKGVYVPLIFALLPSKRTPAYKIVFDFMKTTLDQLGVGDLQAVFAMADFERSLRNAWNDVFPNIPLKNCFFHYAKVR